MAKLTENRFKEYATMTYSVSLYLQSPEHYNKMMAPPEKSNKKSERSLDGLQLLIQSGGIGSKDERGKFFQRDYYFENIQFKNLISGTSTGAAHNAYELNFNIIEPNGIEFMQSLQNEIQEFNKEVDGNVNLIVQPYLMIIRFYGYDAHGNIIKKVSSAEATSDADAVVEKFIPFMFKNISFKLEDDQMVYKCEAVPSVSHLPTDVTNGALPNPINIQAKDLAELFSGPGGLTKSLNDFEIKQVNTGIYDVANIYEVEFQTDSKLEKSELVYNGSTFAPATGNPKLTAAGKLVKKATVVKNTIAVQAHAGMKITKFIDMAVRSSKFITDQLPEAIDQNSSNSTVENTSADQTVSLKWFKVSFRLKFLAYDKKRKDWAKQITYVIREYEIPSLDDSLNKKTKKYPDLVKEYDYWFTGKNTEVLEFSQEFNFLYYNQFGSRTKSNESDEETVRFATGRRAFVRSKESDGEKKKNAQSASVATELYSPADQATVNMTILGDPDWIAQSEIFYPSGKDSSSDVRNEDNSMNPNTTELYFSINFNTVVDYDLKKGVADVTAFNIPDGAEPHAGGSSVYQVIYRANIITTELSEGSFIQRLEGTLYPLPADAKPKKDST